jgi:hypothetical protein
MQTDQYIITPFIYDIKMWNKETKEPIEAHNHIFYMPDNSIFDSYEYYKPDATRTYKYMMDIFVEIANEDKKTALDGLTDMYYMGLFWMIPFETRFALAKEFVDNKEIVRMLLIDTYATHILDEKTQYPLYIIADYKYYLLQHLIPAITRLYNNIKEKETILYTFTENIGFYMNVPDMKEILLRVFDRFVHSHITKIEYSRIVSAFALILAKNGYEGYSEPLGDSLKKIMLSKAMK